VIFDENMRNCKHRPRKTDPETTNAQDPDPEVTQGQGQVIPDSPDPDLSVQDLLVDRVDMAHQTTHTNMIGDGHHIGICIQEMKGQMEISSDTMRTLEN